MAHVAEYKKKVAKEFSSLIEKYPIIGVVNMENLPSPQLQKIRMQLRGKVELRMTKRRILKFVLADVKGKKAGVEKLESYMGGMPALLFTKDNPFTLAKTLQQKKSKAPAKSGQVAPYDIVIEPGKTTFSPGPVISELSHAGLKTGVEDGKVTIKEKKVLVKAGEVINDNIANLLSKFGITPMEIGLDLVAVYENGLIYGKDVLAIDEKAFLAKLANASFQAYNLSMDASYPTKDTVEEMLNKAHADARAVAIDSAIFAPEVIEALLAAANAQAVGLQSEARYDV